jgi:hypothetical protein
MGKKRPGWLNKPELAWTPEPPLRFEPHVSAEFAPEPEFTPTAAGIELPALPSPWSPPRNQTLRVPRWLQRLMIALGQSFLLIVLLFGRDHRWWPDNGVVAGLLMVLLLAPLLPIQGLGRISARALLAWTLGAAIFLFGLGLYQHWRAAGGDAGPSSVWLGAMAGAILFIGQSLLLAHARCRPVVYRALYQASWDLTAQLALCGFCAAGLWSVWRLLPMTGFAALFVMALAVALVSQILDRTVLRTLQTGFALALTAILPVVLLLSASLILVWSLSRWLPPFALSAAAGILMIVALNASYRDGKWRPGWRRRLEFAGAILLLPLATLSAIALQTRVASFGFTADRVVAMALVLLLFAYALVYAGDALISLGGGRAMERLETGNRVMAFVVISILAAMVTPLADPVRLAVAEQSWRLAHGAVPPGKFDYAWLRKSGLRFGHEALQRLAAPAPKAAFVP